MKKYIRVAVALLSLMLLTGCASSKTTENTAYHTYYLNKDETRIVDEAYEPKASDTTGMVEEFIGLLGTSPDRVDYRNPLRTGVEITGYNLDGEQLSLTFNDAYAQMSTAEEVLCRAAIVRTMLQIPGVSCVSFYIGDLPLSDSKGNVVGLMTNESFVENPGKQINAIQTATIHLYFSNATGDGLIETTEDVQYSSNIPMEKLVMEHLLDGPDEKGMKSAIPPGTELVSIATTDGVCYVNLDEGFLNQQYEIQEPIVIYSIVDSLSEISTVNKVQISVNGDTSGIYRDSYSLGTLYERNLDFVVSTEAASETEVKE